MFDPYIDTLIGLSIDVNKPFMTNLTLVLITFSIVLESYLNISFEHIIISLCRLNQHMFYVNWM